MFSGYYRRLKWWFWAEVARIIVEEYESPADAIELPLVGVLMGGSMGWVSVSIYVIGTSTARLLAAAIFAFFGGAILAMAMLAAAASVVYATHPTEVDPLIGGHDGRA